MSDPVGKLRDVLNEDISRFDKESCKHKAMHRRTELAIIVASALTTIVAGLSLLYDDWQREIQFAVIVISATSTAITSWGAARRSRDLWQHEREVFYALKDIVRELDFRNSIAPLDANAVEELFRRSTLVLASSGAKWSHILQVKPDDRK